MPAGGQNPVCQSPGEASFLCAVRIFSRSLANCSSRKSGKLTGWNVCRTIALLPVETGGAYPLHRMFPGSVCRGDRCRASRARFLAAFSRSFGWTRYCVCSDDFRRSCQVDDLDVWRCHFVCLAARKGKIKHCTAPSFGISRSN
jgi:hypothetical protein